MNKLFLYEDFFTRDEKEILSFSKLSASLFTYSTGVKAVRLKNDRGAIVMLPYMGQMIWRAEFDGYDMTMKTVFDEPVPGVPTFEGTYGCFLMHCGLTAMGNPTAEDTHLPHGELPVCKYQSVYLVSGEDEKGKFIGLSGVYTNKSCYALNYEFSPFCKDLRREDGHRRDGVLCQSQGCSPRILLSLPYQSSPRGRSALRIHGR